ncbi:MAG: CBS domain-containing protein [bacterium]|nr:CBS domain-containing protein [bacterium]
MSEAQSAAVTQPTTWERLRELIAAGDADGLRDCLQALAATDVAHAISRLSTEERTALVVLLDPADAAEVIVDVPDSQAVELLGDMASVDAAAIVDELRSDHQVDLLTGLDEAESAAIIDEMDSDEAADVRLRLAYDSDTAGGLMVTEYLAFPEHLTVADVVDDMRRHGEQYSDYNVQYTYVITDAGLLAGVVPMRSLLLAGRSRSLGQLMIRDPLRVTTDADIDALIEFFDNHGFLGVPVVDAEGRLAGVVHRREIQEAQEHQVDRTFLESRGIVGGEELRSMSVGLRSRRRLSWLGLVVGVALTLNTIVAVSLGGSFRWCCAASTRIPPWPPARS